MSYNPSIFDDKISVLAQVETLKQIVKDHEGETSAEIAAAVAVVQNQVDQVETQLGFAQTDIVNVMDDVSELQQSDARSLKIPVNTPSDTQLVGVNNANAQEMITLGEGLTLENNILSASGGGGGGGGKYIHTLKFGFYNQYYLPTESFATIQLILNTAEDLTGTEEAWTTNCLAYEEDKPLAEAFIELGIEKLPLLCYQGDGYSFAKVTLVVDGTGIVVRSQEGEQFGGSDIQLIDTVTPL